MIGIEESLTYVNNYGFPLVLIEVIDKDKLSSFEKSYSSLGIL